MLLRECYASAPGLSMQRRKSCKSLLGTTQVMPAGLTRGSRHLVIEGEQLEGAAILETPLLRRLRHGMTVPRTARRASTACVVRTTFRSLLKDSRILPQTPESCSCVLSASTSPAAAYSGVFDHWLFQHVGGSYSKYSAPRMLSWRDGGLGGNVGIPSGCLSSAFLKIDFTL